MLSQVKTDGVHEPDGELERVLSFDRDAAHRGFLGPHAGRDGLDQNTHYILVQTTYAYTPTIGGAFMSSLPMSNQVFMIPRESASIPCTSALCCLPLGSQ